MATVAGMLTELTLEEYKVALKYYREQKSSALFDNDSYEHARALISELARGTKESGLIQIHTSIFCDTVFGEPEVISAFKEAAERNAHLHVIAAEKLEGLSIDKYSSIFEDRFKKLQSQSIEIDIPVEENKSEKRTLNNFMVVDGVAFRYEQEMFRTAEYDGDCHKEGRIKMKAVACFNDAINAGKLSSYFSSLLH